MALLLPTAFTGCGNSSPDKVKKYIYRVENRYPHDPKAYTQGLFVHNGVLYESTGQYGASSLRKTDLKTGAVQERIDLPANVFAEGACVLNDKIYQLSWQEQTGFVYDLSTLAALDQWRYQGEGWGLTTDGEALIMSDGSSVLRFLRPSDFTEIRSLNVTYEGKALPFLNELEYIDGEIWANVYTRDYLVRIHPISGKVTGVVFLQNLLPPDQRTAYTDVLNGIAYDTAAAKLFVTGKNWPALYEISVVPLPEK
jgi:glutamine cyclotransferase